MDLKKQDASRIRLAQNRDNLRVEVNIVVNLRVLITCGEFLDWLRKERLFSFELQDSLHGDTAIRDFHIRQKAGILLFATCSLVTRNTPRPCLVRVEYPL